MSGKQILSWMLAVALVPLPGWGRDFYMPEGTEIKLALHTSIDTKINQEGDRLICSVTEPVMLEGLEVIPVGTRVHGRIADLQRPRRFPSRPGRLVIAFESIEVPGGGVVQISGSLWDLYDPDEYANDDELPDVNIGEEGQLKAAGPRKLKRMASIAGGAGAGAAAGGLGGAAIGVAVGAGVAFLWFKGKHVQLPAGMGIIMRVDRGATVSVPELPPPRR
ncbi:MAG: hypothetical protein HY653_00485 [Acidobacteria bacterium]|nr:hypothetical protein [Acidobacteriota bacterium]